MVCLASFANSWNFYRLTDILHPVIALLLALTTCVCVCVTYSIVVFIIIGTTTTIVITITITMKVLQWLFGKQSLLPSFSEVLTPYGIQLVRNSIGITSFKVSLQAKCKVCI